MVVAEIGEDVVRQRHDGLTLRRLARVLREENADGEPAVELDAKVAILAEDVAQCFAADGACCELIEEGASVESALALLTQSAEDVLLARGELALFGRRAR
jgi:hypothetical protein